MVSPLQDLVRLEVRHCNGLSNRDLMKISDFLVNLRVLNVSEIKFLNDNVLKSIARLKWYVVSHRYVKNLYM